MMRRKPSPAIRSTSTAAITSSISTDAAAASVPFQLRGKALDDDIDLNDILFGRFSGQLRQHSRGKRDRRRLGIRAAKRGGDNVTTLEGAILGLLALMIGFTFAMALARFEGRRDAVLNEANAIGTTALRARLLPAPYRAQALKLLQLRPGPVGNNATHPFSRRAERGNFPLNALQEALWQQAKAVVLKDTGMVPTGLFIQSLNEMIDNQEKRLTALRSQVPNVVLIA